MVGFTLPSAGLWEVDGTETQLKNADAIDMQSEKIINLTDPANAQDAVTKNWCETIQTASVLTSLGTQTEILNMGSNKIVSVTDPTLNQDAATKKYVNDQVAITKGTYFWSCNGCDFKAFIPSTDSVNYNSTYGSISAFGNGIVLFAPVYLPHGAVVVSVDVNGNSQATAETWKLLKVSLNGATSTTMANANIGTADTTISSATIDNENNSYYIETSSIDIGDAIHNAIIEYTL